MSTTVDLAGLRGLGAVLNRLPQGAPAKTLAEKLGLWSTAAHDGVDSRRKLFPANFSRLSDPDLSDQNAYWLSEVFRATELCGLLEGQKVLLTLQSKQTRASVRAGLRRSHREAAAGSDKPVKDPTAGQLADEVEEDARVQEMDETLGLLAVVQESAKAYKEACLAATAGLSREISFRQAQMGARLR